VDETYDLLAENATVTTYLPTLTARFAKQRLTDQGRADGLATITVPQVLFICAHNAGRCLAGHRARHPRRHRPQGARTAVRTSPGLRRHLAVHLDHA